MRLYACFGVHSHGLLQIVLKGRSVLPTTLELKRPQILGSPEYFCRPTSAQAGKRESQIRNSQQCRNMLKSISRKQRVCPGTAADAEARHDTILRAKRPPLAW